MNNKRVACFFACAFVCASFGLCASAPAQTVLASVTGRVLDPNAAAIIEATIAAKNVDTGIETIAQTNDVGIYHLVNLDPGNYEVSVSKRGFKVIVKPGVTLHVGDTVSMNFTMQVGPVSQSVTVEAGAPMINTTDAEISTVVDQTYIKNMPLNGRSFQDLILLTPGTVTQTPQISPNLLGLGRTGEFSVNGQRTESNYYTVDGVSANVGTAAGNAMTTGAGPSGSVAAGTALGTTQALISVDALQEFRVQSSTYSAEYGRNPGGQFAFATKSGTNQWHGSVYDYLRNGAFDAQDWFNNYFGVGASALRQNDFGGTSGGPVEIPRLYHGKDKTFFFVSYEGLRLAAPQAATVNYVPDAALRANAPAGLNQALNAFPLPNGRNIADGIAEYIGSWSNPASLNSTSVRFDHVVNDKLKFFFRFSDTISNSSTRQTSASGRTPSTNDTLAYTLRTYTAGISRLKNRINNEFRINYSSNELTDALFVDALGGNAPLDLLQFVGLGFGSRVSVGLFIGPYSAAITQGQRFGTQRQWNVVDTVSLSLGRHLFKFGLDYRRLAPYSADYTAFVPYYYFSKSAVLANNAFTSVAIAVPAYPSYTNFSAFAQDEWRASSRLSISLGLRWEVNPAPGVTQGLKPYTFQGSSVATLKLAPQGTPLWQTTWYNFAPRLGVSYVLREAPGRETVLRGGGGVFFDTGQQLGSLGFLGKGFNADTGFGPGKPFPVIPAIPATVVNPPVPPYGFPYAYASHLQLPYTLQWNASIAQALGKSQALTVSYVGSHAARLLKQSNIAGNPNVTYFIFVENGLTSDYNSLQLQFWRRLSRQLTALASYTWSHCMDYGSQNYVLGYQRGNCDFDVRSNASIAFSYDLPNVGHSGLAKAALHHWGLDHRFTATTAFPLTLAGNRLVQPDGQFYYGGLNFVPGQRVYLYGDNCTTILQGLGNLSQGKGCPGGRAINPLAFTAVTSGLGNAPRNFARGFGAWQINLAVRRDFPIYEKLKLQFRAEAFNIFNHPNFGRINSSFGQKTFGQATGTLANSLGILNPLYQMGGPRSLQFALRLVF